MKVLRVLFLVAAVGIISCPISSVSAEDLVARLMADKFGGARGEYPGNLIIYIGNNKYPIINADSIVNEGIKLGIYNLDAQRNMEERLVLGLPTDQSDEADIEKVRRVVDQRFNALSQEEIQGLFQPVMLAERWDIRKTPAFIFGDGQAVVYGITDASVALEHWRKWSKGKQDGSMHK